MTTIELKKLKSSVKLKKLKSSVNGNTFFRVKQSASLAGTYIQTVECLRENNQKHSHFFTTNTHKLVWWARYVFKASWQFCLTNLNVTLGFEEEAEPLWTRIFRIQIVTATTRASSIMAMKNKISRVSGSSKLPRSTTGTVEVCVLWELDEEAELWSTISLPCDEIVVPAWKVERVLSVSQLVLLQKEVVFSAITKISLNDNGFQASSAIRAVQNQL